MAETEKPKNWDSLTEQERERWKTEQEQRANYNFENGERIRKGLKPLSFKTWKNNKGLVNPPKNSSEEYLRRAEIKDKLDSAIPEPLPPEVEGKPITDFKQSYKDSDGNIHVVEDKRGKNEIVYKQQKNDNLVFMSFFGEGRIYYNREDFSLWLYVMNLERTHILRKYKIADHDLANITALGLLEMKGDSFLKAKRPRIYFGKRFLKKIKAIKQIWDKIENRLASNSNNNWAQSEPKFPCFCLVYRLYNKSSASKLNIPSFKFCYHLRTKGVVI